MNLVYIVEQISTILKELEPFDVPSVCSAKVAHEAVADQIR